MSNYTKEEIYLTVGREDKTASLTFKFDSDSFNIYGSMITVVFIYTQYEREDMDKSVLKNPYTQSGLLKAKYLGNELSEELQEKLLNEGVNSDDIINIMFYSAPEKNTFHSFEKRQIKKLTIETSTMEKGADYDWMYGFTKKLVNENVGLSPKERQFYLAGKYYFESDKITEEEQNEVFASNDELDEEVEFEFLKIKHRREEINEIELTRLGELIHKMTRANLSILDKYLRQTGSSLKKWYFENIDFATDLFMKVERFIERRLNVRGKIAVYVDIDCYLHVYMRHVEEMKVNNHFEKKDNFQWKEEDVFMVMSNVIKSIDKEIQEYFLENPGKRFSKYGRQSIYFQGDYYTTHIESNGRIGTFYKNSKQHEREA
ncbi:hypothetical protein ACFP1I_13910 [Dyadobacter subterraneus]|uniref:Uncharacterized protein n=1 Tax=Dyadobacter subterraneus TaxID=2773304 RepID=A0ABR9WA20_9BACT|nr:hypothetical protein [Dyadobacter subterraneus]MBE9462330.1 hypothetical protein [Dyadobacter subterraneus]